MRPLGHYRPAPAIPPSLTPLIPLSRDLRFAWRREIARLYETLDPAAWEKAAGNPVEFLRLVSSEALAQKSADAAYRKELDEVVASVLAEDASEPAPPARPLVSAGDRVAYFCAEFGISEVLPIYSGGLGVLAGDHLKAASDMGLPLVGVGLFYREGFFRQLITADGRQREAYPIVDPEDLPLELLPVPSGGEPVVRVRIADRDVAVRVWRARVGRVTLLLLDSHLPANRPIDREITSRLYGGDIELRIQQELILGVGGMRALDLAGLRPTIRHANEGHAAFLGLEKIRQLREEHSLSFEEAREVAAAGNIFTTHTPVPAGIDLFPPDLLRKYMARKVEGLGLSFESFSGLGRQVPEDTHEWFSMAVLGLRLSATVNGVSKLHATVSRRLWRGVFTDLPLSEIPIEHVTNGVHRPTWTAPAIAEIVRGDDHQAIDLEALWRRHEELRTELVRVVRERVALARKRRGAPDNDTGSVSQLNPEALTIGFARRFATYKRATLIFHDPARLQRILANPDRPVQLVFAGKAHPKDLAGKEFLRQVGEFAERPEFRGRIVLIEGYDLRVARALVAGCDVWLNNPRRPLEASGTSGMKAAMNGVLNLSVLDGWWDEAERDGTGFAIGEATDGRGDDEDAAALYSRLEGDVIRLFYDRPNGGIPKSWAEMMSKAAVVLGKEFSTERMLGQYVERSYAKAGERVRRLAKDGHAGAKALALWKAEVVARWGEIGFQSVVLSVPDPALLSPGEKFDVEVVVRLGGLTADDVVVDWFEGATDSDGAVDAGFSTPLECTDRTDGRATYRGSAIRPEDDRRGYSVRLRPFHPELTHANEMGLVLWAG